MSSRRHLGKQSRKKDNAMKRHFDSIWVREGLESAPEVATFLASLPNVPVNRFTKVSEIAVPGKSMAERITNGKRVLVIDRRSGSLLDQFVNHDPGAVCPTYPRLVPSTNCVYGCSYCFLQGTYRGCRPFVCAYVIDVPALDRELRRKFSEKNTVSVISAGEMSDPLGCDVLGYMPRIVAMFGKLDNLRLLILTKSGIDEFRPLLNAEHNGHTIASWSITCEEVIAQYEPGNVVLKSRLEAAKAAQQAGYEVRFRLDPLILFDEWPDAYGRTISSIYDMRIAPARFTLGSFRFQGSLGHIIKGRFPKTDLLDNPMEKEGKRWRYKPEVREEFYRYAITCIRKYDTNVPIALCRETSSVCRSLAGLTDRRKCNCLP